MVDYLLRTGKHSAAASYAKERNIEVCTYKLTFRALSTLTDLSCPFHPHRIRWMSLCFKNARGLDLPWLTSRAAPKLWPGAGRTGEH